MTRSRTWSKTARALAIDSMRCRPDTTLVAEQLSCSSTRYSSYCETLMARSGQMIFRSVSAQEPAIVSQTCSCLGWSALTVKAISCSSVMPSSA